MQLQKLILINFQGIKSFIFEPNGQNASVFGTNAVGKTTLYNALTWLLFDKASTGEKGFSPKTKDKQGNDVHFLENTVEGTFRVEDGRIITFKKVFHEEWGKKRGSLEETFSGHKTEYYKDSIPMPKCDYDSQLAALFNATQAQVLTQPLFFSETMSWQDRRKLLLEVCGDISDDDVIRCNEKTLGDLSNILLMPGTTDRFYSVDDYKKIAISKSKEINEKIIVIPSRIDEAKRAMPDISSINADEIKLFLEQLRKEKSQLEEQKAAINNSTAAQALRKELADKTIEIIQNKAAYIKLHEGDSRAKRARINTMELTLPKHSIKRNDTAMKLHDLQTKLENKEQEREKFESEYKILSHSEYQPKESFACDTVCPTCGQAILEEKIEAARKKFNDLQEAEKAAFNLAKSKRLEEIRSITQANCSKIIIADFKVKIVEEQKLLEEIDGTIANLNAEIKKAYENIPVTPEWETTAECAKINAQADELKKKLADGDDNTAVQRNAIQGKIDGIQSRINEQNEKLYKLSNTETQKARISELEKEEKQFAKEYEKIRKGIYLCEEFIRAKVSMLTDNINNRFESVKFKLFEDQINGGLKECCEVMVPGKTGLVKFGSANNAARINAGLEINDTLSHYWDITMPIFIDNAEGVVQLNPIDSQVIRLVVSEQDHTLRAEVA